MNIKQFLSSNARLKAAFQAIHTDMSVLNENHEALKRSSNEWIHFLDRENRYLKNRVDALETKLSRLSGLVENDKLRLLDL
ncbi:hypothetical protein ACFL0V_05245 [Nanoarchaeota archaeon]